MKACPHCKAAWPDKPEYWVGHVCSACHAELDDADEREHSHKYMRAQLEGEMAQDGAECPYSRIDIGRYCAWMAGYHDARWRRAV